MPTLYSFLNSDLSETKPGIALEDRIRHLTEGGIFKDSRKVPEKNGKGRPAMEAVNCNELFR